MSLMIWASRSDRIRSSDQHRLQRLGIVGKRLGGGERHVCYGITKYCGLRGFCESKIAFFQSHPGNIGAAMSLAGRTRFQSNPSSSAESCAEVKRITPSSIFGQQKSFSSSLFASKHTPVPSQNKSFNLSARLALKT